MTDIQYTLIKKEGQPHLTVIDPETGEVYMAPGDHPNYKQILEGALDNDPAIYELFDVGQAIQKSFQKVTDRISVKNGKVYFDLDPVDESVSNHILRLLEKSDDKTWQAMALFLDKLMQNPQAHSREQAYKWLAANDFTITETGDVIGYKGVKVKYHTAEGRATDWINRNTNLIGVEYLSTTTGHAIADGVEYGADGHEYIPNAPGTTVEMPRSEVVHDPGESCSVGLHIGTFNFAASYGQRFEVHINPRDIVSVPSHGGGAKMRVCRYFIVKPIDKKYDEPIVLKTATTPIFQDLDTPGFYQPEFSDVRTETPEVAEPASDFIEQEPEEHWAAQTAAVEEVPIEERTDGVAGEPIVVGTVDLDGGIERPEEPEKPVYVEPTVSAHLANSLTVAVQRAKAKKKSVVLLREMRAAGYEPKPYKNPTASTTLPEDWQRL